MRTLDTAPRIGTFRRVLDVALAGSALVLLSWLLAIVALAVRLSSPGPVLFRQRRIGRGRQLFTILKFRTMTVGQAGPAVTSRADLRVTRVGAFLRRTSLDELPQLVNVVRGDMTLVGPRPETPELADRYPPSARWVLEHTPGLTGPTQITLRDHSALPADDTDLETWYLERLVPRRVAADLTYLQNPSPTATLRLIALTLAYLV